MGFKMKARCPCTTEGTDEYTEVDQLDVFCNLPCVGTVLLQQGKQKEVLAVAEQLLQMPSLRPEGLVLRAKVSVAAGKNQEADALFEQAVREAPDDFDVRERQCEFLFDQGDVARAERALQDLLRLDSEHAPAYLNLGQLYLGLGELPAAAQAFEAPLRLRPQSPAACAQLGHTLRQTNRLKEALGIF